MYSNELEINVLHIVCYITTKTSLILNHILHLPSLRDVLSFDQGIGIRQPSKGKDENAGGIIIEMWKHRLKIITVLEANVLKVR